MYTQTRNLIKFVDTSSVRFSIKAHPNKRWVARKINQHQAVQKLWILTKGRRNKPMWVKMPYKQQHFLTFSFYQCFFLYPRPTDGVRGISEDAIFAGFNRLDVEQHGYVSLNHFKVSLRALGGIFRLLRK